MRIRSIKPEFWRSRHVAQLPWDLRLLFIGLWSYVDDNGVGLDDPWQITSDVFPVEPDPVASRRRVERGLATLSREVREPSSLPFLVRYEVSGRRYLYVTGWRHQRVDKPSRPRYPLPSEDVLNRENWIDAADPRESVASPPGTLAPVTEEQRNRGTKRFRRKSGGYSAEFEQWWTLYPKRGNGSKGSKFEASKAWVVAGELVDLDALAAATKRYADSQQVRDGFAKDAERWLRSRGWEEHITAADGADVADWLRGEWSAGRVRHIEERTGLRYPQPDIPLEVAPDQVERWLTQQCRDWIAANHDLIVQRLGKESA